MISIALSTFKEIYRKKIAHVIGILTILYLALLYVIVSNINKSMAGDPMLQAVVSFSSTISVIGFYFSSMLVAFLTVMLSIGVISSEIESGTILTILTKPIKRRDYILGKYMGTAVLVILYSVFLYVAVIIISSIGKVSLLQSIGALKLAKGFVFFIFEPLVILSLSLWGSTKLKTLNNGIFVMAIYILGTIGGVVEQIGTFSGKASLSTIGIIASLISPFEVIYRKMTAIVFSSMGGFSMLSNFAMEGKSTNPSVWMMVYVCAYLVFFIFMSIRGFEKKDIG